MTVEHSKLLKIEDLLGIFLISLWIPLWTKQSHLKVNLVAFNKTTFSLSTDRVCPVVTKIVDFHISSFSEHFSSMLASKLSFKVHFWHWKQQSVLNSSGFLTVLQTNWETERQQGDCEIWICICLYFPIFYGLNNWFFAKISWWTKGWWK